MNTGNVARAAQELGIWFYWILIDLGLNGHMELVDTKLDSTIYTMVLGFQWLVSLLSVFLTSIPEPTYFWMYNFAPSPISLKTLHNLQFKFLLGH